MKRKLHTIVKYAGRLVLPAICTAALGLSAYADIISDVPYLDAASMESSAPAAVTPPPASAAASGNGTVLPTETSPAISADDSVIVDTPDATGGTASNVAAPAQSGTAAQAVSGPVPGETSPAAQTGQESTASAARTEQESASLTAQADTAAGPGPGVGAAGASGQIQTGEPGIAASADTAASAGSGVPGADHAGDPAASISLGFTLVSPAYDYSGIKVAEGSVQLSDGSWETIGHNMYIRRPYYKLLREDGDWYIVAMSASRIGNHSVSDGQHKSELWLRKSECTATSSLMLNTVNPTRQQIVIYALSLLGKGYRYAGNGPDAFDCSGFVRHVMEHAGISVPRTSYELCNAGTQVGITGLRPGDIVGRPGHVGIYIGNGNFVHASESSTGVVTESLEVYNGGSPFTSYVNVIGD